MRGIEATSLTAINTLLAAATTETLVGAIQFIPGKDGNPLDKYVATLEGTTSQTVDVTLTAAQVKALNATPVTLVAAPGSGLALELVKAELYLDYNSAAYAGIAAGEDICIRNTDGSGAIQATIEATGLLDATTDQRRVIVPGNGAAVTLTANAALVAHMATGEVITGDSPVKLRITYRTVDFAF